MLEVAHRLEAVRAEFQRRRASSVSSAVELPVITPPRSTRLGSAAGLAPTEMAPPIGPRWHFAVGALALAASGALFLFSRFSDSQTASAATTTGAAYVRTDTSLAQELAVHPVLAPLDALPVAAAVVPPSDPDASLVDADIAIAIDDALATAQPSLPATPARVKRISTPPAPRASTSRSTAMAHRSSTRKVPVAPRRATKIDPDGTIDPYR
jgi:hypothetical protein